MHPIHSRNFGPLPGKIAVKFYNGSTVVTGWIVKQLGMTKYNVSNGTVSKTVRLAQTTSELTALTAGTGADSAKRAELCTIEIAKFGGSTENCKKIVGHRATTIQGSVLTFKRGTTATVAGTGTLTVVANSAPTVANAIPNQTATVAAAWSYTFPANTFADVNGQTLTYTATLSPSGALPTGITFAAATRKFSKAAAAGAAGTYTIRVTASDGTATVSDDFDITIS